MMTDYQRLRSIFAGQEMPFAFVDLDALDANITAIVKRANDKLIRVASKSVRSRGILKHVLSAHPQIQGVMCFTTPEAVWLSQQGYDDLLLGYPTWHPEQVKAICGEVRTGKTIRLMVDSVEHIAHLQKIAQAQDVTLQVCLDIDMSVDFPWIHFGVWRSGVTGVDHALAVWRAVEKSPNIVLDAVMGYEAQIAGVGDNAPNGGVRNKIIRWMKGQSIDKIATRRGDICKALQSAGAKLDVVNGGGTGSMETTRNEPHVTEITVGSGFYSSSLFDNYQAFKHQPSAGYAVEIVRQPKPDTYTCHGGGYVASGGIGTDKQPVIWSPQGATLTDLEGAGEVQTPVIYAGTEALNLGDPIFMRHSKAGELCERFNTLLLVRDNQIVDEIPTYRGEGKSFL